MAVFTDKRDNWCRFERTIVSFDSVGGQWHCPCRGSGQSHRCVHHMMAMWWIYQESPKHLSNCDTHPEQLMDMETELLETEVPCPSYTVNDQKVAVMTEYLAKQKRIPPLANIPLDVRTKEMPPPTCFIPSEMNKTACGRMLDTINLFNTNTYHHQTVRKAFHHFLSMMDFGFDYSCHQCGHNPPIVIGDANWKVAFDVPVGTFKRPDLDTVTDTDLNIDVKKTWADLDKEMIAEGFTADTEPPPSVPESAMDKTTVFSAKKYIIEDIEKAVNYRVAQLAMDNSKVLDFSKKEIRIYDSLKTWTRICEDDMDLLKNVFRKKGGLQDWRVRYPVQWLQKDSNSGRLRKIDHALLAAKWCQTCPLKGKVTLPEVTLMGEEQLAIAKKHAGEEEAAAAERLFDFHFEYQSDYNRFSEEFVEKGYKVDGSFKIFD
ncbi:hypothetical protein EYF80_041774 [Liparis tanakae]|uniref:Uncharacterized protein n=1 Tax=Liparis tanakae TaxID=230148 RepID=A0A4Z2G537_9TELE|nr:hypothetical protein EYF80_041774 [Liparis tanakae]